MVCGSLLPDHALIKAVEAGRYQVIEGFVSNFAPQFGSGRKPESFTVSGIRFSYSQSDPSISFRWTFGNGGPIQDGMHVRIEYVGARIVRLEECDR
jgi:hypothetical protein